MVKIDPQTNQDYENKNWQRPKSYKRLRRNNPTPPTLADRAGREEEIRLAREARVKEAEGEIKKHLAVCFGGETEQDQDRIKRYINWVKNSLQLGEVPLNLENCQEIKIDCFTSSVKAGGQQRQKSHTAVRVTHLPTNIFSQNQDERFADSNKKAAIETLAQKLEAHLELWRTIKRNSLTPVNIEERTSCLIRKSN